MKKLFVILTVVVLAVFTACQKEDVINPEAIRAQLAKLQVPNKERVISDISENLVKSATSAKDEEVFVVVRIFALEDWTFDIYENKAIKYLVYYELDKYNYRKKFLTLKQTFPIINGEIDSENYYIEIDGVGCRFNKDFHASITENATTMVHFCIFDNESRDIFSYNSDNYGGWTPIPPIADANWKFIISYDNGEFEQKFPGEISNYSETDIITVDFQIKKENALAKVKLEESVFEQNPGIVSVTFIEETKEGEWINSLYQPVFKTKTDQTFSVPFNPTWIVLCTEEYCRYYYLEGYFMGEDSNGIFYYKMD